jgi:hypothetical protein
LTCLDLQKKIDNMQENSKIECKHGKTVKEQWFKAFQHEKEVFKKRLWRIQTSCNENGSGRSEKMNDENEAVVENRTEKWWNEKCSFSQVWVGNREVLEEVIWKWHDVYF